MKKSNFLIAVMLFGGVVYAQTPPVKISWSGELNSEHYPLDSVVVTNKSNVERVVFRYPDTVLVYGNDVGIRQLQVTSNKLRVFPNPFSHTTQVEFSLAQSGEANLAVYDVLGREVLRKVSVLESGTHSYKLSLPSGFYTLRLQTADGVRTARMVSEGNCLNHDFIKINKISRINNLGNPENLTEILVQDKAVTERSRSKSNTDFPIEYGDTLVLQGYITESDTVLIDEHTVPLTEDAFVLFTFKIAPPPLIKVKWTAELNCNWHPLDSVVLTNISTSEKATVYYPDTVHAYSLYEYGDTFVLRGFITDGNTVHAEEHTFPLTKDTLVSFAFFKAIEIPFTEYVLGDSCQWKNCNYSKDTILIINSNTELENYTTCTNYPTIDFSQYSLLLASGSVNIYVSTVAGKGFTHLCPNNYQLDIEIYGHNKYDDCDTTSIPKQWQFAILVPKLSENSIISQNKTLFTLQGTKWKLVGLFDAKTDTLIKVLNPMPVRTFF